MKKLFVAMFMLVASTVSAQQKFVDLVGPVPTEPVKDSEYIDVPVLTWGGDVPEFLANGNSLKTAKGSINDKLGLKISLVKGDDFVQQTRNYMAGKAPNGMANPFLRGTMGMLGQASEVTGSSPGTKPHVLVQLTYSAGDHLVCRADITTLNDFGRKNGNKKHRYALQQGGPHVHLLYQILAAAQTKKDDIELVWCTDLSGPNGPAEKFRTDPTIDGCFVITPDMIGLTGDAENKGVKGTGAEGTVKDAHVVVSTQTMNRAVSDVWAVRSDWYESHKDFCNKFVAGYLKAVEETVALRKQFTETNKMSPAYRDLLTFSQKVFGKEAIPTIEVDGHGLMLDALFVGLPGQISFFEDKGNLTGYERQAKQVLDMATEWGYVSTRSGFVAPKLNYEAIAKLAGIAYAAPQKVNRIVAEGVDAFPDSGNEEPPIYSFSINFEPNQEEFSSDQYGSEFNHGIQAAATNRNAVLQVRGHSDPTKTLTDLIKAGKSKNIIEQRGQSGAYKYFLGGDELNLSQTDKVISLIKNGAFDNTQPNPRETMNVALQLSFNRAQAVTKALADFAAQQKVNLDISQIKPVGVGIMEPLNPKPRNIEEAKKNMRVEFRLIRVSAESVKAEDFEY